MPENFPSPFADDCNGENFDSFDSSASLNNGLEGSSDKGNDGFLDWQDEVPVSRAYGDVYYSRQNGMQESRYVFIDHNGLPSRWSQLEDEPGIQFTIGETGFGTGLNFLTAWQCWRSFGFQHTTLHFVSIEKFPLTAASLARAHTCWPELAELSALLCNDLPLAYTGAHRRCFDNGRVILTLLHGDAAECLEQWRARIDAWFLDGFAPTCNPDLWSPRVFAAMAALSHCGTTFATFTSASQVRRDMETAGFQVQKDRGFRYKREMCFGQLNGPDNDATATKIDEMTRPVADSPWFQHTRTAPPRTAIVIGAGLAGCAAAHALAQRGLQVTVLDEAPQVASAASGNPIGLTFVRFTAHASSQNRYYVTAYLHAMSNLRCIFERAGIAEGEHWRLNGILRVIDDAADLAEIDAFLATPQAHLLVQTLDAETISALAGFAIDRPGFLQPGSGWLNPASLCRALLAPAQITTILSASVTSLEHVGGPNDSGASTWEVRTAKGVHTADAVILANSKSAASFPQTHHLVMRTVRGQITHLPPSTASISLQHAINYSGYLTPVWQGTHTVGATFHPKRHDTEATIGDHTENIARLRYALPAFPALPARDEGDYAGRVAFRAGTPDYLPYVGPAPVAEAFGPLYQEGLGKGQLKRRYPLGPVHPQLYINAGHGSRGITSSLLAAEVLCHWIFDEPAPVDTEILHALHPARFLIRNFKRRQAGNS